jgi:hypothetical protein
LLAALALDPDGRARRVLDDIDIAAIKRELRVSQSRPARWWKRRSPIDHGFSFCGRSEGAPGVAAACSARIGAT